MTTKRLFVACSCLLGIGNAGQHPSLEEVRTNYAGLLNSYFIYADYKPLPPTRALPVFLPEFPEKSFLTFDQVQKAAPLCNPEDKKLLEDFIRQTLDQRKFLTMLSKTQNNPRMVVDYLYYNVKPKDFGYDLMAASAYQDPKPDTIIAASLIDSVESPKFKNVPVTPPWLVKIIQDEYAKVLSYGKGTFPNLKNRHFGFEISEAPKHSEPLWAETDGSKIYLSPRYVRAVFILAMKTEHYLITSYNYHLHSENGKPDDLLNPKSVWSTTASAQSLTNRFMAEHDVASGCGSVEANIRNLLDFPLAHELMHIALAAPNMAVAPDETAADDNASDLLKGQGKKAAVQAYHDFVQNVFDSDQLKYFNLKTTVEQGDALARLKRLATN